MPSPNVTPTKKRKRSTKTRKPPVKKADRSWHKAFLAALEKYPCVRDACRLAGVQPRTYYRHYETYGNFRVLCEEAKEAGVDRLAGIAWKRAEEKSDSLLIFLLKTHRPEIYNPRIKIDMTQLTDEELERLARG